MRAFLNERSLEPYVDLPAALTTFLQIAIELLPESVPLFRDTKFFGSPAFKSRFNNLSVAGDVRGLLREMVFGTKYYGCWRSQRMSTEADMYRCAELAVDLVDESVCEAAARRHAQVGEEVALISAVDSIFGNAQTIELTKIGAEGVVQLLNFTSVRNADAWRLSRPDHYSRDDRTAPRDHQTVLLKEPGRFRPTKFRERGFARRIFVETATERLFYVDEGHPGHSAHLEVFSAREEHLGEADIDAGELDPGKRVAGRVLRL